MGAKRQRNPRDYFYGEVLRLPPGTTSPDHYALLGVPYFESDHDAILTAALARIRLLESCRVDMRPAYRKVAKQLLVDVREAQMTLLEPARRKEYDAGLTGMAGVEDELAAADAEVDLPTGTMLRDRYRVMGEVRHGGLGIVWEAMDRNLRRKVHLSLLRPRLSQDKAMRRRIEEAARTATDLDHPNLLRIDEVEDADGLLFVRSRAPDDYRSLIEVIEATPALRMPADEVRRVTGEIAAALQSIHEHGAIHGDLRPHNIFLTASGRVLIADACVTRAVAEQAGAPPSRYREPEDEASPAGDLFALGCVMYQMLAGMPPFGVDPAHYAPKPLPEDVPEDLEVLVMRLLAREPDQRVASAAEVRDRVAEPVPASGSKRVWLFAGAAAVVLLAAALAVGLFGGGNGDAAAADDSQAAAAWRLIAEGRLDDAIAALRAARRDRPDDEALKAPLAKALEDAAPRAGDPWTMQTMLAEAQALEPTRAREIALRTAVETARRRLDGVAVTAPAYAKRAVVTIERGDVPLTRVVVAGAELPAENAEHEVALERPDGRHEIAWLLVDRAGNERTGTTVIVVDTVAPNVRFLEPAAGAMLQSGSVPVRIEVEEPHAPRLEVRGRPLKVVDGVAADRFALKDGEHELVAVVVDAAGNTAEARVKVVIDTAAPEIELTRKRVVTRDGSTAIAGRMRSRFREVRVDGKPVRVGADGAFAAVVRVTGDRLVPVEATGVTGLRRKVSVAAVIDRDPPRVAVEWSRRDRRGVLLYGSKEMDARALALPLRATDKTSVRYEPSDGVVADGVWKLPPHEGKRDVRLAALDEAGNRSEQTITIEGHRATPRLDVKCAVKPVTRDETTTIEIDAGGLVFLNDKPFESGRHRVPLEEGEYALVVRAVDRWGNESRWTRQLLVDRTPPRIVLRGAAQRGVGEQELVFDANEPIATVTCGGRTYDVDAAVARIRTELKATMKKIVVVAKDRAGNSTKTGFPLDVANSVLVLDQKSALRVRLPKETPLEEFTVECWVRGFPPEKTMAILSNYAKSDFSLMWSGANDSYPYAVYFAETSGRQALQIKKPWTWSDWTHIALSFDGKKARYYVNGSLQSSIALKEKLRRGGAPLYIGAESVRGRPGYFFKGAVDDVRVSSVARYARAFRPARHHKADDDTVLLLNFESSDAKRFVDRSKHGHPVEAVGAPRRAREER